MKNLAVALLGLSLVSTVVAQDAPVPTAAPPAVAAQAPSAANPVAPAPVAPATVDTKNPAYVGMQGDSPVIDASKGPPVNDEDEVARRLLVKYPKLERVTVRRVQVGPERLYEFKTAGMMGYTNPGIDWILVGGELISTGSGAAASVNITKMHAAEAGQRLFNSLPLTASIKYIYGTGERPLLVFADPDCPFCHQLDIAMQQRGASLNATVYVLPYPLVSLHPQSANRAKHIWCSQDPAKSWASWMQIAAQTPRDQRDSAWAVFATQNPAPADCPAAANVDIALKVSATLGVSSTPTVVFENGVATEGTTLEEIEQGFAIVEQTMGPYRKKTGQVTPQPAATQPAVPSQPPSQ